MRRIDASKSIKEVYHATKQALLPEVFSIVGPRGSGKTKLGTQLAERTNMELLNFSDFLRTHGKNDADDEAKTQALIHYLQGAIAPRFLLEDFP